MLLICCYLFLFRTKCINTPCKCHFINKMEGFINIIHISLQSKCSTCSRTCKNDQTCNNAYRKWRGSHNPRFTRYPTLKITRKIIMLETMKGLDTVERPSASAILVIRNSKQMIISGKIMPQKVKFVPRCSLGLFATIYGKIFLVL